MRGAVQGRDADRVQGKGAPSACGRCYTRNKLLTHSLSVSGCTIFGSSLKKSRAASVSLAKRIRRSREDTGAQIRSELSPNRKELSPTASIERHRRSIHQSWLDRRLPAEVCLKRPPAANAETAMRRSAEKARRSPTAFTPPKASCVASLRATMAAHAMSDLTCVCRQ